MCHHQQTTPRILPASPQEACASPTLEYKHLAVEAIVPNVLLVLRSGLEGNQVFLVLGKDRLLLRGKLGLDLFEDVFRARVRRVLRDSRVYRIRYSSHTFCARALSWVKLLCAEVTTHYTQWAATTADHLKEFYHEFAHKSRLECAKWQCS